MGTSAAQPPIDVADDCSRCVGLCCVALEFARSADFAIDKPAGQPCPNLDDGLRCRIHARLRESGFPGCVAYTCFGAGQRITATFAGGDWRGDPHRAGAMVSLLPRTRAIHELLWLLGCALAEDLPSGLRARLPGADLRAARLHRADLRGALFLSRAQLEAAQGSVGTRLPATLDRPSHWGSA